MIDENIGTGGSLHDYSAYLLDHGSVSFMIEDERLTRVKHSEGVVGEEARQCLTAAYWLADSGR